MNVDGVEIDTLWNIQQLLQDKEIDVRLIYSYGDVNINHCRY